MLATLNWSFEALWVLSVKYWISPLLVRVGKLIAVGVRERLKTVLIQPDLGCYLLTYVR